MSPTDPEGQYAPGPTDGTAHLSRTKSAEDELMERVRSTARRITERVRKALGDTQPDQPAQPINSTDGQPPA